VARYTRFVVVSPSEPKPQVEPSHYGQSYETRRRYLSYWNQLRLIAETDPQELVEVGIGNGFLARQVRASGRKLCTVDFDARLGPDVVASVTALPLDAGSFDVACCFETLEHLPWSDFVPALRELARVSRRKVLLSLPDVPPYVRLTLAFGIKAPWLHRAFDAFSFLPRAHRFDGQHHWEIGKRGFSLGAVKQAIESAGLRIESTHRDYDDPYHRMFVCTSAQTVARARS
jgi:ubiquinone/menaquinone biosynthesis C-methylase UbiE